MFWNMSRIILEGAGNVLGNFSEEIVVENILSQREGTRSHSSWELFLGCFGAPPLRGQRLVAGQRCWGGPWWGAAPTNGGKCWEIVGPHVGTPWTREHVFSMFGGNMFSLFGGCMFSGLKFQPPPPLPPLYKEEERCSPTPLQLSHKCHA